MSGDNGEGDAGEWWPRDALLSVVQAVGASPEQIDMDLLMQWLRIAYTAHDARALSDYPWKASADYAQRIGAQARKLRQMLEDRDAPATLIFTGATAAPGTILYSLAELERRAAVAETVALRHRAFAKTRPMHPADEMLFGYDLHLGFGAVFGHLRLRGKDADGATAKERFVIAASRLIGVAPPSLQGIRKARERALQRPDYDGALG